MDISWIKQQIRSGQYLWSFHADEERRSDGLEITDVEQALLGGCILETYPNDPRGSSCLVCGESKGGPIHVVCGRNSAGHLILVTVYKPTYPKWKTSTERGK